MMDAATEAVAAVIGLVVSEEWTALGNLTAGSAVSPADIRAAIADYGRTPILPPGSALIDLDGVPVTSSGGRVLNVRVPLWTREEGRSDLEIVLTLREVIEGVWSSQADDIVVP